MIPGVGQYLDSTLTYIKALPISERSIRRFCIIPFVIGYRTLVKIAAMEGDKISRKEIASIMSETAAFAQSNLVLEQDYLQARRRFLTTHMGGRPD